MTDLYKAVRTRKNLRAAWRKVYENGISSRSLQTQQEVREYSSQIDTHLARITRQLRDGKFSFKPGKGIAIEKASGGARPIVLPNIESRIVQRAILNILQDHEPVSKLVNTATSFGGIKGQGVRSAIERACLCFDQGALHYIRSDIKSFFTMVPKPAIVEILQTHIDEKPFISLFEAAISVELSNFAELEKKGLLEHFPIYEIGVAQGSCLSPFLANLLLHEFDVATNSTDVTCLRYIDDFLILGPTQKAVQAKLRVANRCLKKHGLSAYTIDDGSGKAVAGQVKNGFSFLGCDLKPGMVSPTKGSRNRILSAVWHELDQSLRVMKNPSMAAKKRRGLADTLKGVSNILKGWGNQYQFCNNAQVLRDMDGKVSDMLEQFQQKYIKLLKASLTSDPMNRRRLMGVHVIADSKKQPIYK